MTSRDAPESEHQLLKVPGTYSMRNPDRGVAGVRGMTPRANNCGRLTVPFDSDRLRTMARA